MSNNRIDEDFMEKVSGGANASLAADTDIEAGCEVIPTKRVNCLKDGCNSADIETVQVREGLLRQVCKKCGTKWYVEDMMAF